MSNPSAVSAAEVASVLEISSQTKSSHYQYPGANYTQMIDFSSGIAWGSHNGYAASSWSPEGTNNVVTTRTASFVVDNLTYYQSLSAEDQLAYFFEPSHFSEIFTTNTTTSAAAPPEYRATRYSNSILLEDNITTNLRLLTKGYTNSTASSVFLISATAQKIERDADGTETGRTDIPPEEIQILNRTLGTNGSFYTNLADNAIIDLTPIINTNTYSNYVFTVSAERVKVTVNFRNSGYVTPPPDNGVGYDNNEELYYYTLSTTLGEIPYYDPVDGFALAGYRGYCELSVTNIPNVPDFDTGWEWHRDVQGKVQTYVTVLNTTGTNFTGNPYNPSGSGNDPVDNSADSTLDANRHIFNADTAGYGVTNAALLPGTVIAFRITAREWVTWNGAVASNIKTWHYFYTIKKTATGWIKVGGNTMNKFGEGEDTSILTEDDVLFL